MSVLTLPCLFFGDGPDKIFRVKILETENVDTLKEIIWEKHADSYPFDNIAAKDLVLWKVSLPPVRPYAKLAAIQLNEHIRCQPEMKIYQLFCRVSEDIALVEYPSDAQLSLNCWISGDDAEEIFEVTIRKNRTVSFLREVIKEKNSIALRNVEAKRLRLWAVNLPNIVASKDYILHRVPLSPMALLSEVIQMPVQRNHLHVIVDIPIAFKTEGKNKISFGPGKYDSEDQHLSLSSEDESPAAKPHDQLGKEKGKAGKSKEMVLRKQPNRRGPPEWGQIVELVRLPGKERCKFCRKQDKHCLVPPTFWDAIEGWKITTAQRAPGGVSCWLCRRRKTTCLMPGTEELRLRRMSKGTNGEGSPLLKREKPNEALGFSESEPIVID